MTLADAPTPRRMGRPRWLDVRVVGGVLLLVASVVVGAKVVGASSQTSPVWVAAQDLAAGTVLRSEDLVAAQVNLGDRGSAYLGAGAFPEGRMLNRPINSGELLPAAALGAVGDLRVLSVAVTADRMAPDVRHGSVIDLYLTSGNSQVSRSDVTTVLLAAGITVQSVTAPASGGLSAASSIRYQVALLLSPPNADALVRALPSGEPLVVLRTDDTGGTGGRGDDGAAVAVPSGDATGMTGTPGNAAPGSLDTSAAPQEPTGASRPAQTSPTQPAATSGATSGSGG